MPLYLPSFDEIMAVAETRGEDSDAPHLWRGLVGAWPLQEPGGATAFDVSGYGRHGALSGGPVRGVSRMGRMLTLDGSGDYVTTAAGTSWSAAAFGCWFSSTNYEIWERIIEKGANTEYGMMWYGAQINKVCVQIGATVGSISTINLNDGVWRHLFAVIRPSGASNWTTQLYINGRLDAEATITPTIGAKTGVWNIGRYGGGGYDIAASLSHIAVYHDVLPSPAEIQQLYADPWAMYRLRTVVHPVAVAAGGDITETASPVSATWSVVAPSTAKSITPDVVSATFTAVTPATAKTIALAVVSATWSPVAPATVKTIAVDPVTATWTVPTPTAGGSLITVAPDPVAATWSPITPATSKTAAVSPVSASWSVPTPTAGSSFIAVDVSPVTATWSPVAPATAKTTTPDPVSATWTPAAPTTAKTLSVDPVALTWSIVAAELTKATTPDPVAAAWLLPDITTAGGAGTAVAVDPVVATWTVAVARGGVKPVLDSANVLRVQSESRVLRVQSESRVLRVR